MIFESASRSMKGELYIPGDKSISHRAVMFGSIARGDTLIRHFLNGADCLSTISCFRKMGVEIELSADGDQVTVHGRGLHGLSCPDSILDCGNSGTTTRLISGILSGQNFSSILTGDDSICRRPMKRIMDPLTEMNADITSIKSNGCMPLAIHGRSLRGIHYYSPVSSAQVKSCVLLAGLYAEGITSVTEPVLSRNHTELMLQGFGATVCSEGCTASIQPDPVLEGIPVTVPGDISSAAYFICAALMIPGSDLLLHNIGINPTRDGILKVITKMGGHIERLNETCSGGEMTCDLHVTSGSLKGTVIEGDLIPALIDEIPVIAVLAAYADGTTIIRNAEELHVKESDRIDLMVKGLSSMGADISATRDGMILHGGRPLHGSVIESHLDHRIAMSFAIASLIADGTTEIKNAECVNISYPGFYHDLASLLK